MDIHFRLKDFREAHGILQRDLSDTLGLTQGSISRFEKEGRPLTGLQYQRLAKKYGEVEVSAYIGEETLANMLSPSSRIRPRADGDALAVIKAQQDEIARLNRRIEELTDRLLSPT